MITLAEDRAPLRAFVEGLSLPPFTTVSEWADERRVLSRETSAEPGPWRTDRTPYLREPLDRLGALDPCQRVVVQAGAQIGKTEIGLNWLGYVIHVDPGPCLAVQPTVELGERWSRQRLDDMIRATPALASRVAEARSRQGANTMRLKQFAGGVLVVAGANSAAGLRSMPARCVFLDEVDAYPINVDAEGDPVDLAIARTATFASRKILLTSTPTIKGVSRIERAYEETDRRRFYVPCQVCGAFQVIEWPRIRWEDGAPDTAGLECEACGVIMPHSAKAPMLARGEWRATAEASDPRAHGYHVSSLYSPWVTWAELARRWVECHSDPLMLQTFVNTVLGESWEDSRGDSLTPELLLEREHVWDGRTGPRQVAVITAGVDVQDDRIECEVVAWGPGEESWSLSYRVIRGDPSTSAPWAELADYLAGEWPCALGPKTIAAACVDTGGHHTQAAYRFCGERAKRKIWAIKGRGGQGIPIWPRKPGAAGKSKVPLYIVGVDAAKAAVVGRLRIPEPGPGYCHVPADRDESWHKQITAEVAVTTYHRGRARTEWKLKRAGLRNEALDCRVYAYAALQGWYSMGRKIQPVDAPPSDRTASPRAPTRTSAFPRQFLGGRRGGWTR